MGFLAAYRDIRQEGFGVISDKNGLDSSDDANGLMLAIQEAKARRSNILRRDSEVKRTKV